MELTLENLVSLRLPRSFYARPTLDVARDLLGKYLVVSQNNLLQVGEIIETEAYIGQDDQASHGRFGPTPRTQIMFGPPGFLYVYLIYGLYHLINFVTENEGFPAAVLIRGLKPVLNIDSPVNGPGKLTKALNISKIHHGLDLTSSSQIFVADSGIYPQKILTTPRIGISYAGSPWIEKPWRFIVAF